MTNMHLATRKALYRRLQAANPEPTTELLYNTPFELLVAVMLSAHTTDKSVNAATRKLFPVAHTPEALLNLGEDGIIEVPRRTFNAGDRVRLTDGPMEGFAGIFEHYRSGSKRVALLLNVVGASMKVVVPATSVAAAAAD